MLKTPVIFYRPLPDTYCETRPWMDEQCFYCVVLLLVANDRTDAKHYL
jgi:hypothetical protein